MEEGRGAHGERRGLCHELLALGGASARSSFHGPLHLLSQGDHGRPLLLIHGGSGGGANWYRQFAALAQHHRVLAPDLPNFGLSDDIPLRPPLGEQAARLLIDLLDELRIDTVDVCGTSFGGLAALRLAQHFPARVRRLVLLDAAGLTGALPWGVAMGTWPLLHRWALRTTPAGTRLLLRTLVTSMRLERAHEEALIRYLVASAAAHPVTQPASIRAFVTGLSQREVCAAPELRAITAPVLLLWGERDRFFPLAQARAALPHFAHAELRVIERAGHSPNWEAPARVVDEILRFLN